MVEKACVMQEMPRLGPAVLVRVATYMQSMRRESFKLSIHIFSHQDSVRYFSRRLRLMEKTLGMS